jgi:hypothetical protein
MVSACVTSKLAWQEEFDLGWWQFRLPSFTQACDMFQALGGTQLTNSQAQRRMLSQGIDGRLKTYV